MINLILESFFDSPKLVLYKQGIVSASTNELVGYEVLARIKDVHNKVMLLPGNFVAALEQYDLQESFDRVIVNRVINYVSRNIEAITEANHVYHVNISAKSLDMLPQLLGCKDPKVFSFLCFEVTEHSSIVLDVEKLKILKYCRDLGITISFDDFGASFVSYTDVQTIKPDYLKIDGYFVTKSLTSSYYQTVVSNQIALAKQIGAKTIAEFIENKQLKDFMISMGIDYLQGWYLGDTTLLEEVDYDVG